MPWSLEASRTGVQFAAPGPLLVQQGEGGLEHLEVGLLEHHEHHEVELPLLSARTSQGHPSRRSGCRSRRPRRRWTGTPRT